MNLQKVAQDLLSSFSPVRYFMPKANPSTPTLFDTCAAGWASFDGNCYLYTSDTLRTFDQCTTFCQNLGVQPVCVTSNQENIDILANLPINGPIWIGYTDAGHEGTWTWVDPACSSTYTHWGTWEPNGGTGENCAVMNFYNYGLYWNDWACGEWAYCACQYSASTPIAFPTLAPTAYPTASPSSLPTMIPSAAPTPAPTFAPTYSPSAKPTVKPTAKPTVIPTATPTANPTAKPTAIPSRPTANPTAKPSRPTCNPTLQPTRSPTTAPSDSPCDPGYIYMDGNCYYYQMDKTRTFDQCTSYCQGIGVQPVCVSNSQENADLLANLPNPPDGLGRLWLGSTDASSEGTWTCVDPDNDSTFTDFNTAVGEPNGGTSENCAVMNYNDYGELWNDWSCTKAAYCVCEYSLLPTAKPTAKPSFKPTAKPSAPTANPTAMPSRPTANPTTMPSNPTKPPTAKPTALPTATPTSTPCLPGYVYMNGNCYIYATDTDRIFSQCTTYCQSHGVQPVCIMNDQENTDIYNHIPSSVPSGHFVWLGQSDVGHTGTYAWVDPNCTSTYTNWFAGEGGGGSLQNCVGMNGNNGDGMQWDDVSCSGSAVCVCQYSLQPTAAPTAAPTSVRRLRG